MKSLFIWLLRMALTILAMVVIYAIMDATGWGVLGALMIIVMVLGIYWSFNQ